MHGQTLKQPAVSLTDYNSPPSPLDDLLNKPLRISTASSLNAPTLPSLVDAVSVQVAAPVVHGNPNIASKWTASINEQPMNAVDKSTATSRKTKRGGRICMCGVEGCNIGPFKRV